MLAYVVLICENLFVICERAGYDRLFVETVGGVVSEVSMQFSLGCCCACCRLHVCSCSSALESNPAGIHTRTRARHRQLASHTPFVDSSPSNGLASTALRVKRAPSKAQTHAASRSHSQLAPHTPFVDSSPSNGLASAALRVKRWGNPQDAASGDVHYYNYADDCQVLSKPTLATARSLIACGACRRSSQPHAVCTMANHTLLDSFKLCRTGGTTLARALCLSMAGRWVGLLSHPHYAFYCLRQHHCCHKLVGRWVLGPSQRQQRLTAHCLCPPNLNPR